MLMDLSGPGPVRIAVRFSEVWVRAIKYGRLPALLLWWHTIPMHRTALRGRIGRLTTSGIANRSARPCDGNADNWRPRACSSRHPSIVPRTDCLFM